jgi:hypothetical protein
MPKPDPHPDSDSDSGEDEKEPNLAQEYSNLLKDLKVYPEKGPMP